ncbi:MAG: hypothetical protein O3A46_00860 [Candidatus Poribacteria bacterium]|nr:hypothetical protein [Candidatus Poribacteria bacterium]
MRDLSDLPEIPKTARDFIENGAPEGKRATALINAANAMRHAGFDRKHTSVRLVPPALKIHLTPREIATTLKIVFRDNNVKKEPDDE